ncbi:hypothetical protein A8709_25825 [Paenibacillus pectinilyticus]|uniref:Prepilin-type N-terminal cleavage/methylation domain-containing protein n=1 Tax=Paenibacillus pectinilyticus TaxID=512399 RepID=A0A1C1A158_9BACL|nr:prepilin-type N-terminal cleavage/methylation domain-containing protein [Paenibacillus pectinilyticus]OCT14253.1 hypothetical protein A8709_25825 [Paenibacillus pectinilyticus]
MNRFVRSLKNEEGLSLVELIAALTILSLVMGTIYGVITFGFTSYNKVNVENALRDEADIVMSSIMTELYTVGPTTIETLSSGNGIILTRKDLFDEEPSTSQIFVDLETPDVKSQIRLGDPTLNPPSVKPIKIVADLKGSTIQLECGSIKECHSGLIIVDLHLQQNDAKGIPHTLNLKSRFGF